MAECEKCGASIGDKYKFCFACVQEMKKDNAAVGAVVEDSAAREIQKVNNNLYAIRTILEAVLEAQYKKRLRWDKETKRFLIEKIKK